MSPATGSPPAGHGVKIQIVKVVEGSDGIREVNMARKRLFKSAGLQHLCDQHVGGDPERAASFEAELANAEIAQMIYDLRKKAGLTQHQLAKRIGTTASVICRLEYADYKGHSLPMLRRIAVALGKRVEIRFVPAKGKLAGV